MNIPRERSLTYTRDGGSCGRFTWYPNKGPGEQVPAFSGFCRDNAGLDDDYPLDIERTEYIGGHMNRDYPGYYGAWFYDWVPELLRPGFNLGHLGTGSFLDDAAYATSAVARTNPSRPYVDTPRELAELRDLSRIMRDRGASTVFGRAGQMYLGATFGTLPILQTLNALTNSHKQIATRVKEIQQLVLRGLRRTLNMGKYTANSRDYRYIDTAHLTAGGWFNTTTTEIVRCHVRWKIAENAFANAATPKDVQRYIDSWASRSVLGVEIDLSTAYELMPWSWLVDWFASTGDYLSGCRNIVPAILEEVTVMRHLKTDSEYPGETWTPVAGEPSCSIAPIRMTRESKHRRFSFATPFAAHIPAIDGGRAGTLASLSVTRLSAF